MTNRTQKSFEFPAVKRRKVEVEFSGGDITSDGGVLLLREVDRRLGLGIGKAAPEGGKGRMHGIISLLTN